ncbi:MAG TPA: collagenase [Thermomicrobiales bacterium]
MVPRRFHPRWAGLVGCFLVLLTSVAQSQPATAAADVDFSVGDTVSSRDEQDVREAVRFAQDYLQELYDYAPADPLVVNIRNSSDPADPGAVAYSGGDFLVVYTGSQGWVEASPFDRLHVIVHEYLHVYQFDFAGRGDDAAPAWLHEGMAEYLSYQAVIERGLVRARAVADYQAWAVAQADEGLDLKTVESLRAFQSAEGPIYPLSYLAIAYLVEDGNTRDLDRFFRTVGEGADWRSAFAAVFGRDVDAFYEAFARWRSELIAPTNMPKAFAPVKASTVPADAAIETVATAAAVGEQTTVVAETEPGAQCKLRLRSGNRPAMVNRGSVADAGGLVFWLVTIPAELPPGPATVTVSCGGERSTATIEIEPAA